ncbi:MAG: transposase [Deltaproteobacteria bacterium]|nr:transposase [Deltaproteobacteria bacterium]
MANFPRSVLILDNDIFHVTWKCHNDDWLLSSDFAKSLYYKLLLKYKNQYGMIFHSYCFMDNHPHLTGKCTTQKLMSDFFRVVNSCFAKTMNKFLARKGQVVMDRFKSPTAENQDQLLRMIIYTDMNPARTVRSIHPKEHRWSSYQHYAYGKSDDLLTDPECYLELGNTPKERQKNYRNMIQEIFENDSKVKKYHNPFKQQNGRQRFFIGNPSWARSRHEELLEVARDKKKQWLAKKMIREKQFVT